MKSFNLISKFNFIVICLVCLCSLFYINCEICNACTNNGLKCTGDGCLSNCRPHFPGTSSPSSCISCNTPGYYSIDEFNNCNTCTGNKVIIDSNECISSSSCEHLYSMRDACYSTCPEYSIAIGSECHCLDKYYFITISGTTIKIKICLPPNTVPSGYIYYSIGTDEFKNSCPSSTDYIKDEIIGGKQAKRCSTGCIGNEFHLLHDTTDYCVDSCLNTQKIYIDGSTRECIEHTDGCSSLNDNTNGIVFLEKNNYCIKKEECKAIYGNKCFDSCLEKGYYKKYGSNECLATCDDTTPGFKYPDEVQKICYNNCPFVNEDHNRCFSSCNIGQGFYIEGDSDRICYTSCENTGAKLKKLVNKRQN